MSIFDAGNRINTGLPAAIPVFLRVRPNRAALRRYRKWPRMLRREFLFALQEIRQIDYAAFLARQASVDVSNWSRTTHYIRAVVGRFVVTMFGDPVKNTLRITHLHLLPPSPGPRDGGFTIEIVRRPAWSSGFGTIMIRSSP